MLFIGGAAILLAVVGLAAWAVWGPQERRGWLAGSSTVWAGGVLFPAIVLAALLAYSVTLPARSGAGPPVRIEVVGERWWWRVRYLDDTGTVIHASANELHLPAGRPVELTLTTADVIHSLWLPTLAGKLDMTPGHVNSLRLLPAQAGIFRGQCAEYCGGAHALMAFYAQVHPAAEFDAWLAARRQPRAEPGDVVLRRGYGLFQSSGCGACHTVRGTPANGEFGPDLSDVGGRLSLGAGILPNNADTLAGWIVDARDIKPGIAMPPFPIFSGDELHALAAYLESLK